MIIAENVKTGLRITDDLPVDIIADHAVIFKSDDKKSLGLIEQIFSAFLILIADDP